MTCARRKRLNNMKIGGNCHISFLQKRPYTCKRKERKAGYPIEHTPLIQKHPRGNPRCSNQHWRYYWWKPRWTVPTPRLIVLDLARYTTGEAWNTAMHELFLKPEAGDGVPMPEGTSCIENPTYAQLSEAWEIEVNMPRFKNSRVILR